MIEQNRFGRFDFPLFWSAIALWVVGIFLVYSATYTNETGPLVGIYKKQIFWVIMAIVIIVATTWVPGRFFASFGYVLYSLSLLLLVIAIVMGTEAKGAERWVSVGGLKLQPSEFAKIGLMLALARYLSKHTLSFDRLQSFIVPSIIIMVPFVMVLKQPDLGTAIVLCAMAVPMFYWAGLSLTEVFILVSPAISLALSAVPLIIGFTSGQGVGMAGAVPWGLFFLALFAVLYFARTPLFLMIGVVITNLVTATITTLVWGKLEGYQKMRIISFVDPQQDAFGAGYQVIQSKVAIGSGYLFGKGYLHGTQIRLSFLPEQHTDFIFSVLGEQFGLVGCTAILGLFLFLVARGFLITQSIRNRYYNLVVVGSISIIAMHVFINTAMTLGMMPVVGIPLPFLSYGGSFTLTLAILIGLILNAKISD